MSKNGEVKFLPINYKIGDKMRKYLYDDGEILGVEEEKTVKTEYFAKFDTLVLVTKDGDYYNIYLINDNFRQEPLNNLYLQEPTEFDIPNRMQLEIMVISHYLWFKYGKEFTIMSENIE
jgi:hypothetical protein